MARGRRQGTTATLTPKTTGMHRVTLLPSVTGIGPKMSLFTLEYEVVTRYIHYELKFMYTFYYQRTINLIIEAAFQE